MYRFLLVLICLATAMGAQAKTVPIFDLSWNDNAFVYDFDPADHFGAHTPLQELGKLLAYVNNPENDAFDPDGDFLELFTLHIFEFHPKLWSILEKHPFFKDKIPTDVPVPGSMWLYGAALALLIGRKRATATVTA